jgi:putative aldouronate transport system permease protein
MVSRARFRPNAFDFANYLFLALFSLSVIYPFWDMLMKSFSSPADASRLGFALFPSQITLSAYRMVFGTRVLVGYANTIFRTVIGTVLALVVVSCAAFPLSKKSLPLRNTITLYLVFTMFFSGGLIPAYLNIKNLGLIDSRWALIVPSLANVFNILIVRNFMSTIDRSLEESAAIDGASQLRILFRIIIPVSKPILATVALWTIVGHWNAWFDAMIYINSTTKEVLQLMLRKILIQYQSEEIMKYQQISGEAAGAFTPESLKAAFMYVTITPIILTYPFLQRYFVKGIMIGSLKG